MKKIVMGVLCFLCVLSKGAEANELSVLQSQVSELTNAVKDLRIVVEEQQREIQQLKSSQTQAFPSAPVWNVASPKPSGHFTPEIGAVADVVLSTDSPKADEGGADRVNVRELELVLGSNVDPYSRLDGTIAFTEEAAELEEAYLTRFELPFDVTARAGRFKPKFGKDLAVHRDSLDTVDEPLVIQRYFGEEGMSKSGVDLTKLLDISLMHQITLGVLEGGTGEGGTAFGVTKRTPTLYSRLKSYLDISDTTNLEIGLNDALGSRDADTTFEVNVFGIDGTLIHQLSANQTIKLQGEVFNVNRTESEKETVDDATGDVFLDDLDGNVWGGYGLFDFRLNSQWAAGFRYDQVELVNRAVDSPNTYDVGYSGYLTFYQSEFARWRLQYTYLDLTDGSADNRVWIQGTFAIGDHKHKLQ